MLRNAQKCSKIAKIIFFSLVFQIFSLSLAEQPIHIKKTGTSSGYEPKKIIFWTCIFGIALFFIINFIKYPKATTEKYSANHDKTIQDMDTEKRKEINTKDKNDKQPRYDTENENIITTAYNNKKIIFDISKFKYRNIEIKEPYIINTSEIIDESKSFIEIFIKTPLLALDIINRYPQTIGMNDVEISGDSTEGFVQNYQLTVDGTLLEKFPLFFMDECSDGLCPLTRRNEISLRSQFEENIAEAFTSIMEKNTNICSLICFGSGDFFSLLRSIVLSFVKYPTYPGEVNIHCIDREYNHYVFFHDYITEQKKSQKLDFNYDRAKKTYLTMKQREYNDARKENEQEMTLENAMSCLHHYTNKVTSQYKQIEYFIKSHFPLIKMNLILHHSDKHYLTYKENNKMLSPDLIYNCDIDDGWQSVKHFKDFCRELGTTNPALQIGSLNMGHPYKNKNFKHNGTIFNFKELLKEHEQKN